MAGGSRPSRHQRYHSVEQAARGVLSDHDKSYSKQISLIRSAVERAIAHMKIWKILVTGYRARRIGLSEVIRAMIRLEYYRLGW